MEIFRRRPFMLCCTVFIALSAASFFISGAVKLVIFTVALLSLALISVMFALKAIKKEHYAHFAVMLVDLFMAAIAALESFLYFDVYLRTSVESDGELVLVEATVTDAEGDYDYECTYYMRLHKLGDSKISGKAYVKLDYYYPLSIGDRVTLFATQSSLKDVCESDTEYYSKLADGIRFAFCAEEESSELTLISTDNAPIISFIEKTRNKLCGILEDSVDGESGRLSSAILLGDRYALSNETRRDFSRAGIYHLLALSGLHLTVLTGIVDFILRKLRVHKLVRASVMPFLIFAYLALTGFSLPTLRAAIMLTAVYVTFILAMPSDTQTVLFFTGFLIILCSPQSVTDVGFWMSFLATFGVITVSSAIYSQKDKRIARKKDHGSNSFVKLAKRALIKLVTSLLITFAANLAIMFLVWICFGEISLATPITNLIFSPLVMIHLVLSFAVLIFSPIPIMSSAAAFLAGITGKTVLRGISFVSHLKGVSLSLKYDFSGYIIIALTVTLAILLIIKLKRKLLIALSPIVATLAYAVCLSVTLYLGANESELVYLRAKENEALVITSNDYTVICDISSGNYKALSEAWRVAKSEGATELEALVLTHYHKAHRVSVNRLASNAIVRRIALPYPKTEEEYYVLADICRYAQKKDIKITLYEFGDELRLFGDGILTVNAPLYLDRSVQPTFTAEYSYGDESAIYISSSYGEADDSLAFDGMDYLIFGTHGPIPKQTYLINGEVSAASILFADEELLSFARIENVDALAEAELVFGCEYKKFTLRKSGNKSS